MITICIDIHISGFDQLKSVSNCYKLDNGTWKPHHSLSTGRHDAAASINGEGWMMVSGGRADNTILASTEILTADGWVQGPPLPEPLQGHCQVTINGKILVAGEAELFKVDEQNCTFKNVVFLVSQLLIK